MPEKASQSDGWIQVNAEMLPPIQPLDRSEVRPFLKWLFGDLAVKCEPLKLRESAAVVRYMMTLAQHGVPTKVVRRGAKEIRKYWRGPRDEETRQSRLAVEQIARIVWGNLLQFGRFKASSKHKAQLFLRENLAYCSHPNLERALKFLQECEVPAGSPPQSPSPHFVAKNLSQQRGNSYLEDDLSERVAAADYLLQQAGVTHRHQFIAAALSFSALTAQRSPKKIGWTAVEVRERVKTYERQKNSIPAEQLANKWIFAYRGLIAIEEMIRANKTPSENVAEN